MKVQVVMRVDWEKGLGETSQQFNERLGKMQAHVLRLQTAGTIPRDVRWVIGRREHKPIALPEVSQPNLGCPALVHEAGKLLQMPLSGLEGVVC
jgi:hypothetical protein